MNINMIIAKLANKNKGSFFKCEWISDLPVKAAYKKQDIVVHKESHATVRYGIRYSNMKSVQQKVVEGKNLTHELPWGKYREGYEGILIDHINKAGEQKTYLRLYTSPNKTKVQYYVNGKPITKNELISLGYVQDSYWKKNNEDIDCFTVDVTNIKEIY